MGAYLRCVDMGSDTVQTRDADKISKFQCRLVFPPEPHPVVGTTPPSEDIQAHLSIDVIHLGGANYLNCVDRASGWSEVGTLRSRILDEQAKVFRIIKMNQHGIPQTIICDL